MSKKSKLFSPSDQGKQRCETFRREEGRDFWLRESHRGCPSNVLQHSTETVSHQFVREGFLVMAYCVVHEREEHFHGLAGILQLTKAY